ncbi:atrial natriuretic peptide receptor 1-like [Saccoglossus kowalevskii]|uniref:guanylate cyclase n=1 Tax=Saccoglossus kowalevskii TaxID=10224 RepID=A0ABM0GVH0_SACKO|nr:PREDICTED: guanylate cyclase 2G-like [Saccoglossus kowalevskii]
MWRWLQAYQTMHYTKDRTGIIQVLGSKILAFGAVTQDELTWLVQLEFERDLMFDDSNKYMDERHEVYPEQHFDVYQIFNNIDTMSAEIHKNDLPEPSEISSLYWFGNHSLEVEVFDDIHVHIAHDILEILESNIQKEYTQFVYSIICIALVIVFCPILFVWYARSLNEMMQEIRTYTIRLNAEKLRAEKLLYQMLPPTVAEQLKLGKQVRGESYEEVTIYFSDICGFTEMSAAANSPWDIVDLLDTLYTTFDNQIEKYDVYKVETIGDAYMVVSGLPSRNGSKHFSEMADMSLKLVSLAKEIVIPHQPDRCLKLRIGLHTGPCVAGVVGQKMPRYCLFGDTVNTAARMESTGEPLRIHISEATKRGLVPIGNYVISRRGDLQIKGKESWKHSGWKDGRKHFINKQKTR